MSDYRYADDVPERHRINAGRLWTSGVATAVIAALVAVVGILVARGLFRVPVLAPRDHGVWGDARTASYALMAAVVAVAATGLMHLLSVTVTEPQRFFRWIMVLLTTIAVLMPLTLADAWSAKIGTALINLAIGGTIIAILSSVAAAATQPLRRPATPAPTRAWDEEDTATRGYGR